GSVSVLLGNGDGSFQTSVDYGVLGNAYSLVTGDFDNDGRPDLAVANYGRDNVSVLLNTCPSAVVRLALVRANRTAMLVWPLEFSHFILESSSTLSAPDWQPAPEPVRTDRGRCEVTLSVDQAARYFRLDKR
ncbi:MAG TPA: VCBS repeat-containing protein, partial [Verrucomicrobiae bacterium]|nr:VCBS repeat-containing protein [Verrucomicrobiae bacterium]